MKFHETHFEDYISAVDKYNFHKEQTDWLAKFPASLVDMPHLIFYGGSGVGKYSQVLYFLQRYSPSRLKYEKRLKLETDKLTYHYKISDIHYEVDMLLLGCNSKVVWHEWILQVIDIIANNIHGADKVGVVVCKNFQSIHGELLDIFYSYMQHYQNNLMSNIVLRFVLITESVSFIPRRILQACQVVAFERPTADQYARLGTNPETAAMVTNAKELRGAAAAVAAGPPLIQIVCDPLIADLTAAGRGCNFDYSGFREKLYDILVYNLDAGQCFWYVLCHFINNGQLQERAPLVALLNKTQVFLKQYNNNYRPIYHLEMIFYELLRSLAPAGAPPTVQLQV
jgi:hypothetical protein